MTNREIGAIEKEAYALLEQKDYEQAFKLFRKAGTLYKDEGEHKSASLMFASAGSCWARISGEKAFLNAAESYSEAALEAKNAEDFAYAALLYKFAAINYERDLEFINFSESFYASRECFRKFLGISMFTPGRVKQIRGNSEVSVNKAARFLHWLWLSFSYFFWGYGERPFRTLFFAVFVIFGFALAYTQSYLLYAGELVKPGLSNAVYFSMITFTTVGFGDFVPVGLAKAVAMLEAFCGIFTVSLLVVGLSRKYLRI